jgi:hypothetical protein
MADTIQRLGLVGQAPAELLQRLAYLLRGVVAGPLALLDGGAGRLSR